VDFFVAEGAKSHQMDTKSINNSWKKKILNFPRGGECRMTWQSNVKIMNSRLALGDNGDKKRKICSDSDGGGWIGSSRNCTNKASEIVEIVKIIGH
jgi:hypothetical protein